MLTKLERILDDPTFAHGASSDDFQRVTRLASELRVLVRIREQIETKHSRAVRLPSRRTRCATSIAVRFLPPADRDR
jgi:hypothetical protein